MLVNAGQLFGGYVWAMKVFDDTGVIACVWHDYEELRKLSHKAHNLLEHVMLFSL